MIAVTFRVGFHYWSDIRELASYWEGHLAQAILYIEERASSPIRALPELSTGICDFPEHLTLLSSPPTFWLVSLRDLGKGKQLHRRVYEA